MQIINLTKLQPSIITYNTSFLLHLNQLREIWLFNCSQGCQHYFGQKKIKINQISKIVITSLSIDNISGLLGLLSSLSLIDRKKALHIYSPKGLDKYIELGKKYSQTNFRYNLYLHTLVTGLIINHRLYQVYALNDTISFNFFIISQEKFGKFQCFKAQQFNLAEGPLYGKLKQGSDLLLPDGFIMHTENFTYPNNSGKQVSFIHNRYNRRNSVEISQQSVLFQDVL